MLLIGKTFPFLGRGAPYDELGTSSSSPLYSHWLILQPLHTSHVQMSQHMECQSPHFMGLFKMKKRLGYLNLGKLVHQDLSSTYVMHIMNVISKYHGHLFTSAKGLLQIFSAIVNFIDHHKDIYFTLMHLAY